MKKDIKKKEAIDRPVAVEVKKVEYEIKLSIEEREKFPLTLHMHFGNGSLGDTKFDANLLLPDYSLAIEIEGKHYIVRSGAVISAVVEKHEALKAEAKK